MRRLSYFVLIIATFSCFHSMAQNKNEFRIQYGINDMNFKGINKNIRPSYDVLKHYEFGFRYLHSISKDFQIETGLIFSNIRFVRTSDHIPIANINIHNNHLLSIPLLANYTFAKQFFVNIGPFIDIDLSDDIDQIDENPLKQSGLGYSVGIGWKYDFKKFSLYINPQFRQHSVIEFKKDESRGKLEVFGIQFGFAYAF